MVQLKISFLAALRSALLCLRFPKGRKCLAHSFDTTSVSLRLWAIYLFDFFKKTGVYVADLPKLETYDGNEHDKFYSKLP